MTIIFSDGFESGNFSAWTSQDNSPTVVTTTVHHGGYAMQANLGSWASANCRTNKTITAASTLYTRCYVRMEEAFTGSGQKAIGPRYYYSGGAIAYVLVDCINNKWGIQNNANSISYFESGTSTINAGQWYCLELYTLVNGSTGQLRLWIDGVLKVEQTGINTGTNQITGVSMNAYSQNAEGVTRTIYFDCAVVADSPIGTEEGGGDPVIQGDTTINGNLTVTGSAEIDNQFTVSGTTPSLTNLQILAEIYGYLNTAWQPNLNPRSDGVLQFAGGTSKAVYKDTTSQNFLDQFLSLSSDNNNNPLLCVNQGAIIKKDIQAGGILASAQGALVLGHGWDTNTDWPKITLSHSDSILAGVANGSTLPSSSTEGTLFVLTSYNPNRLYQWHNGGWVSLGSVQNWNGGYDTLHLTRSDHTSPANLDLGTLTAHGNITNGNLVLTGGGASINGYSRVEWNTSSTQEWQDIGSIVFRNIYNHLGMEFKGTSETIDGSLHTTLEIVRLYGSPNEQWEGLFFFDDSGNFHYKGTLVEFDFMDDYAALRSLKTKSENGAMVYDKDSLKFLQDEKGLLSLSACVGWELSIQRKFLQEIDSLKLKIAELQSQINTLKATD